MSDVSAYCAYHRQECCHPGVTECESCEERQGELYDQAPIGSRLGWSGRPIVRLCSECAAKRAGVGMVTLSKREVR